MPGTLEIMEPSRRLAYQNLQHVPRPLRKGRLRGRSRPTSVRESTGTGLRWRANQNAVPSPFLPIIITSKDG
jgi:hypothetical protein